MSLQSIYPLYLFTEPKVIKIYVTTDYTKNEQCQIFNLQ